ELVFLGYAIETDDFNEIPKDLDLKGKVAVIMRRNPQQGNPHGPFASAHGGVSRHAALSSKLSNAFRGGAVAVLFVNEPYTDKHNADELANQIDKATKQLAEVTKQLNQADPEEKDKLAAVKKKHQEAERYLKTLQGRVKSAETDELMKFGYGGDGRKKSIPVFHIKQEVADKLLKPSLGKTLAELEAAIDEDLKPRSAVLKGWHAKGVASVEQVSSEVKNVIGVLEGEGPLANETIVIGAHYDHVGMGGSGSLAPGSNEVHNGADDNASGTVSLLELARRFGSMKEKPSRRLVFIAFTAEERGLIGSNHYVKNPVFPLKDTIAMFNMDMVGRLRDEKLTVFGTGTAKRWKPLMEELSKEHQFHFTFQPEGLRPSDHAKFYSEKIPVLHFFTNTHRDYHRPTDDWDKINVPGMYRVVDLLEDVVQATLNNKERPQYVQVKGTAKIERNGSRPYFGSIPDFGTNAEGYAISGVAPGSPSDKAGLKGGDVIIQIGKQKIGSLDDFDLALRKFKPGDQVDVTVMRKDKKVTLKVVLDKPR
ncbi:MAG: M20/M25/M40 family metallo-hydrolase, partial [Planctomycetaceae bacterium]|nr:M20/M25/M40 family metallo-hydrolase [Planctomycetaceae bacterium]